jgi:hypothetical protein
MSVAVANITRWKGVCRHGGNEPVVLDFETTLRGPRSMEVEAKGEVCPAGDRTRVVWPSHFTDTANIVSTVKLRSY